MRACRIAPAHIGQGSSVTYSVQPSRRQDPERLSRLRNGDHLRVGRGIVQLLALVVRRGHDLAFMGDHRADRHFARIKSRLGFGQGHPHVELVQGCASAWWIGPEPIILLPVNIKTRRVSEGMCDPMAFWPYSLAYAFGLPRTKRIPPCPLSIVACFWAPAAALAGGTAALHAAEPTEQEIRQLGKTPHTRFAVNVEMWWREAAVPGAARAGGGLRLPGRRVLAVQGKDRDVEAIAAPEEEAGHRDRPVHRLGLQAGPERSEEPRRLRRRPIEEGCEVAKQLDCKLMTVVGGDDQPGMTQEQMHENIIDGLKRAAPIAEKHDITLILEPMNIRVDHKGHCLYGSAPTVRSAARSARRNVKINWDLYHMQISEGDLCGHLQEGFDQRRLPAARRPPRPQRAGHGRDPLHRVLREASRPGLPRLRRPGVPPQDHGTGRRSRRGPRGCLVEPRKTRKADGAGGVPLF